MINLLVNDDDSYTGESIIKPNQINNKRQAKKISNQRAINRYLSYQTNLRDTYQKLKNVNSQFNNSTSKAKESKTVCKKKFPRKMSLINISKTSVDLKLYSKYTTKSQRATTPQSIQSYSKIKNIKNESNNNTSMKHFEYLFNDMMKHYGKNNGIKIDKKINNNGSNKKNNNNQSNKTNLFYLKAFSRQTFKNS